MKVRGDKSSLQIRRSNRPRTLYIGTLFISRALSPRLIFRVMSHQGLVVPRLSSESGGRGSLGLGSGGDFGAARVFGMLNHVDSTLGRVFSSSYSLRVPWGLDLYVFCRVSCILCV